MWRLIWLMAIMLLVTMAMCPFAGASEQVKTDRTVFEVLNPWADADPVAQRGISKRIDTISGKKIGLFANFKRAAKPIITEVEKRLKERFPDIDTTLFDSTLPNVTETETVNKEKFTAWAKGVDAVIAAVGD